jgi:oligopeptide transport system substrate-binding protein
MRPALALIAAVLLLGAVLPWLALPRPEAGGPVIVLGLPRTIDPAQASRMDEFRLITALFEPLVRLDPVTLQPGPGLARSWETSPDRLTWTFHLDPQARWSDGRPVVAEDMRRGLLRHLVDQSPNAFYLAGVIAGTASDESDLGKRSELMERCGIACPDAHTLALRLDHPVPYLAMTLSLSAFVPATPEQAANDDLRRQAQLWTDPTTVVGNGPFRCSGWLARHHYDFVPNPRYAGAHPAHGALRALVIENPGTAARLYLSGQADAILLLPADAVGDLRREAIPGLQQATSLSTAFLRVRLAPRPGSGSDAATAALRHPRLRLALARSVDRASLADGLLQGGAVAGSSFVPGELGRYLPYRAPTALLATDLAQARADVAAARAELGAIPPLELIVPAQPAERLSVAELVVDGWRRALGIDVALTVLPQTELRSRERAKDYDLDYATWLGDFLDPTTFLDCFRTDGGANRTGYADAEYDGLLDRAARAEGDERWRLLEEAERRLLSATPLIPLYHTKCSFLVRPGLGGITANALEIVHFDEVGWTGAGH